MSGISTTRVSYKQLRLASAVSRNRRSVHPPRLARVGGDVRHVGTGCETFPVFFSISVGGGLLLAISVFYDPRGITAIGGLVLFALGVALVFLRSLAASRHEGTGLLHAIALSVRKALRFVWALMP